MNPADLHQLLAQAPLIAAFACGIWYADRRAQQRGERLGRLEDRVSKLEGKQEAPRGERG
jgi:hypothetical protein